MRKNISSKFGIALCLLALLSCKSKKHLLVDRKADTSKTSDTAVVVDVKSPSASTTAKASTAVANTKYAAPAKVVDYAKLEKLKAIRLKQVDFDTFSGKAPSKLSVNGDSHDVTLNVRIKKDQQIWVSVTAVLGVEVARALITPDSIKLMNRLESTYLKKPFKYVYNYTSKQLNYKTLESLLIGNAVPELVNDDVILKPDNGGLVLNGSLPDLLYQLSIGPDMRVTQTNISNPATGQSLKVVNAAFIQAGTHVIPSKISINSSAGKKNIQADLHYTKVDFDQQLSFPFTVPARFTLSN